MSVETESRTQTGIPLSRAPVAVAVAIPLREMVAIDYLYVANWSLWEDIKILLRTVPHVVGRRGL
jgi:lipopolysaccharide/colanic/teichoic acid biosynthesis glycosyltransferase